MMVLMVMMMMMIMVVVMVMIAMMMVMMVVIVMMIMMVVVMVTMMVMRTLATTHLKKRVVDDAELVLLVRYLDDVFPWQMKVFNPLTVNRYSLASVSYGHHTTLVLTVVPQRLASAE